MNTWYTSIETIHTSNFGRAYRIGRRYAYGMPTRVVCDIVRISGLSSPLHDGKLKAVPRRWSLANGHNEQMM